MAVGEPTTKSTPSPGSGFSSGAGRSAVLVDALLTAVRAHFEVGDLEWGPRGR